MNGGSWQLPVATRLVSNPETQGVDSGTPYGNSGRTNLFSTWIKSRPGRGVRLGLWFFVESLPSMSSTGEMARRLLVQFEGAIYHVMANASPSPTGR